MNSAELIKAVNDGDFDDILEQLREVSRQRLRAVRRAQVLSAKPGAKVNLVDLSPKYLTSYDGTFVKVEGDRVHVQLEDEAKWGKGKGRYYQDDLIIRAPITSVEIV